MKKSTAIIPIMLFSLVWPGCEEDMPHRVHDSISIVVVDDSTYAAYRNILLDSLHVIKELDGEINGDILHLNITYLAGCEEYPFEMVAVRGIYKNHSVSGSTYIVNIGPADSCQVETRIALDINLAPYREYLQFYKLVDDSGAIGFTVNRGFAGFIYNF